MNQLGMYSLYCVLTLWIIEFILHCNWTFLHHSVGTQHAPVSSAAFARFFGKFHLHFTTGFNSTFGLVSYRWCSGYRCSAESHHFLLKARPLGSYFNCFWTCFFINMPRVKRRRTFGKLSAIFYMYMYVIEILFIHIAYLILLKSVCCVTLHFHPSI